MTPFGIKISLEEFERRIAPQMLYASCGIVRQAKPRGRRMAAAYHYVRVNDRGQWSGSTKETLSELESVGIAAFLEGIRNGRYDSDQGALTTYVVPFIDGAMRRYFEKSLGTLSLDRDSMALVRRAQQLHGSQRWRTG